MEPAPGRGVDQVRRRAGDKPQGLGRQRDGRGQEGLGVGVLRPGEHLGYQALFDDAAGVHDRHPLAGLGHDAEVVGDEQEAGPGARLQFDEDVKGGCRLVGHDEAGPQDQGEGDHDPLAHPAGKLVRVVVEAGGRDPHRAQSFEGALPDLVLGQLGLMGVQRFGKMLGYPHERVEPGHRLLEHEAQGGAAHGTHLRR